VKLSLCNLWPVLASAFDCSRLLMIGALATYHNDFWVDYIHTYIHNLKLRSAKGRKAFGKQKCFQSLVRLISVILRNDSITRKASHLMQLCHPRLGQTWSKVYVAVSIFENF